ncbi:EXS-domain-containing protein [Aulographum hederae CBS 113979]|uniref:EXS-domain-containing protein n=1 Tax=Aulographum hederae CBS 113979 TaxID=1176131 RepID=A0A6G1GU75_9PEZI|nr:EXS-domain-containing protein [Aulographum hederae CBS 113979]
MDGDPVIEPEVDVDGFSRVLPLPYRVAVIIVLGVWAWGCNLHYLQLVKIDVPSLIRYPSRTSPTHISHHRSTYRLATLISLPLAASLLLFWAVTRGDPASIRSWELLPNLYLLVLVICFFLPFHIFSGSGRSRFLATLKRISIGGIAEAQDGRFGDILMADALTSYAKVLGDLFISLCMFFSPGRSSTGTPDRTCGGLFVVPFIIAVPSTIRLRQCLIEFGRVRNANKRAGHIGSHGWGGQHLANALKYSTAFPVIILSALQRGYDPEKMGMSEAGLFRLWLLFVFINSFYSFYWDIAKDWDLSLFSKHRDSPEHPWGLRRHRYFHADNLYYTAMVIDLFLRCTWSFKLSPHLDHFNDLEGGIFTMEVLEVFRRWMWIFFRVETEWGRSQMSVALQKSKLK